MVASLSITGKTANRRKPARHGSVSGGRIDPASVNPNREPHNLGTMHTASETELSVRRDTMPQSTGKPYLLLAAGWHRGLKQDATNIGSVQSLSGE